MTDKDNQKKYPADDPEKTRSSRNGVNLGYMVEARHNYRDPIEIAGTLYDNRWREISIYDVPYTKGIPQPKYHDEVLSAHLLTYDQAQAIRWQFVNWADCTDKAGKVFCLETRIVEYSIKYEWETKAVQYLDPRDRRGEVPKDMR